jgi:hypothetical protein
MITPSPVDAPHWTAEQAGRICDASSITKPQGSDDAMILRASLSLAILPSHSDGSIVTSGPMDQLDYAIQLIIV